ncbi:uncharacterized protein LOC131156140 isoform X2 [Malania oleifera]|uniref:uncharacterized protein LOC131156140 isoform X2 n=1 Tax=Malania oleifera TaxID=397392 RepID=UPI0025AE4A73|nr:uncharacterized protein LOC131156140 isoform X2 [Malania oleifera]
MGSTRPRPESSTKAERKFEKKLQFYAKVRDTVASLSAKKAISKKRLRSRQKKLKAYNLSSLSESLPELKAPQQLKLNSKSRQKLVTKEANQLRTVLSHPAFLSDPLAAIHQHLKNTQPITKDETKKRSSKKGEKKSKKKRAKDASGLQSMAI